MLHHFNTIGEVLAYVISLLFQFSGVIALATFVYGAFSYITSGGNPEAQDNAKQTMTYAVIGLILILVSVIVVKYILEGLGVSSIKLFGIDF